MTGQELKTIYRRILDGDTDSNLWNLLNDNLPPINEMEEAYAVRSFRTGVGKDLEKEEILLSTQAKDMRELVQELEKINPSFMNFQRACRLYDNRTNVGIDLASMMVARTLAGHQPKFSRFDRDEEYDDDDEYGLFRDKPWREF